MPPVDQGRSTSPSTALLREGEDRVGSSFHFISFQVQKTEIEIEWIGILFGPESTSIFKDWMHLEKTLNQKTRTVHFIWPL